jgi:hypothetical protein
MRSASSPGAALGRLALVALTTGAAVAASGPGPQAQGGGQTSGAITGRVVDHANVPLPGVTVTATQLDRTSRAVTDAAGNYRIADLPPGVYQVSAIMPGFVLADGPSRATVVWAGQVANVDLWMFGQQRGSGDEEPREFRLRQLDVAMARWRDAAVDDYRLVVEEECFCDRSSPPETAEALFDRVASAIDLRPDAFVVMYDARYGLPSYLRVDPRSSAVDDEFAFRVTAFEPRARESAVQGRIVDLDRNPIPDADVTMLRGDQTFAGTTTEDGTFRLEAPPGAYRLTASGDGLAMIEAGPLVLVWEGRTTTGEWRLLAEALVSGRALSSGQIPGDGADLSGRVLDISGAALPGVTVTVGDPQGSRSVTTDVRGKFTFSDLAAGVHAVAASLTGFRVVERRVELQAGTRTEIGLPMILSRGSGSEADRDRRIAELDAMMTHWRESRPAAYAYTLSRSGVTDRMTFRVGGHVATFAEDPEDRAYIFEHYAGVDRLFERIAWAIDGRAEHFAVRYDPTYGHPVSIDIDVSRNAVHDELDLRVSDFRPLH